MQLSLPRVAMRLGLQAGNAKPQVFIVFGQLSVLDKASRHPPLSPESLPLVLPVPPCVFFGLVHVVTMDNVNCSDVPREGNGLLLWERQGGSRYGGYGIERLDTLADAETRRGMTGTMKRVIELQDGSRGGNGGTMDVSHHGDESWQRVWKECEDEYRKLTGSSSHGFNERSCKKGPCQRKRKRIQKPVRKLRCCDVVFVIRRF